MTYRGRIEHGQIMLEEPVRLPEGTRVDVSVVDEPKAAIQRRARARDFEPIDMPGGSLADELVRDRR